MKRTIALAVLLLLPWGVRYLTTTTNEAGEDETVCVVTHVDVMPQFTAAGRDLLRQFAAATRKDPGVVRVEVFEELARPNHSTVVELWRDRPAYEAHLTADHTRTYRSKLQPMLGSPFDERLHRVNQ